MNTTTNRLRTAVQVTLTTLREADRRHQAAEFASRLDVAAWNCHREGEAWIAEGPAGNVLFFSRHANGYDVDCASASGGRYTLAMDDDCRWHCDCPDSAKRSRETGCKHVVAWHSVKAAAVAAKKVA